MKRAILLAALLVLADTPPAHAGLITNTSYLAANKAHEQGRYEEARARFEKLLSVKDADIRAIAAFQLHDYYDEGLGVAKDPARAMQYLELAANSGGEMASMAHWRLGNYYETGHDGAYEVNRAKAAQHYRKAIELGDKTASKSLERLVDAPDVYVELNPAQFAKPTQDIAPGGLKMGFDRLHAGDHNSAKQIFEWHARRGDAQAQYALAVLLAKSTDEQQIRLANAWNYLAAKGGWPEAQRNYGLLLYREIFRGEKEAIAWLTRGSGQGDHESENLLGVVAANPKGERAPDFGSARAHFERAVNMGNTKALTNLGDLYANGLGVARDEITAKAYYARAADAGELEGRNRLFTVFGVVHGISPTVKSTIVPAEARVAVKPTISAARRELSPIDLFASVSPSVLTIHAMSRGGNDGSQGSAVSLGRGEAVTNCHVLENMSIVGTKVAGKVMIFKAGKTRKQADLCVLHTEGGLTPIARVRSFDSLKVGERVYAVGSPSGLQNTFTEGLISGLRTDKGVRYIQTSAPISPGSSGGGLFDAEGRLIGITTFMLKDAQGLNFAVSIEELP